MLRGVSYACAKTNCSACVTGAGAASLLSDEVKTALIESAGVG
jgi:hypothetical protein